MSRIVIASGSSSSRLTQYAAVSRHRLLRRHAFESDGFAADRSAAQSICSQSNASVENGTRDAERPSVLARLEHGTARQRHEHRQDDGRLDPISRELYGLADQEEPTANQCDAQVVARLDRLLVGLAVEVLVQLVGALAELDRSPVAIELDDVGVVHLRQMALVESDVHSLSLS